MTRIPLRPLTATLALAAATWAPSAQALSISFRDVSSGGSMTAEQLVAFQAAASYWSRQLSDPVSVTIDIGFSNLGAGILGNSSASFVAVDYSLLRSRLAADATSSLDASAVAHLQAGPALSFQATQGDLSTRLDSDGSTNNTLLGLTTANAKALGLATGASADSADGRIEFATAYAGSFSYNRGAGTPPGQIDFITVAEHEIGHALGFSSGVDDVDECAGPALRCLSRLADTTAARFESNWWYEPLDLYRYSAAGTPDLRVGQAAYFSVDGGATSIAAFATGYYNGNGAQASHFAAGQLNLMRSFINFGQAYDASPRDLAAMDAIGWDLTTAVPEPQAWALWLGGLAALGAARRRRR